MHLNWREVHVCLLLDSVESRLPPRRVLGWPSAERPAHSSHPVAPSVSLGGRPASGQGGLRGAAVFLSPLGIPSVGASMHLAPICGARRVSGGSRLGVDVDCWGQLASSSEGL